MRQENIRLTVIRYTYTQLTCNNSFTFWCTFFKLPKNLFCKRIHKLKIATFDKVRYNNSFLLCYIRKNAYNN